MNITIDITLMNSLQLTPNLWVMLYYKYFNHPHLSGVETIKSLTKLEFLDNEGNLTDKVDQLFKVKLEDLKDKEKLAFLLELRELFPKGVTIAGSPVRSAVNMVTVRKLTKLIKDYGFDRELIVKATKAYVAAKKKENFKYMMKFTNFIDKQNVGSELATYCQTIKDGEDKTTSTGRIERTL